MLPRILVIDDLFGRVLQGAPNPEREGLCAHLLWKDATGDAATESSQTKVKAPRAEAVFCRGQTPAEASRGDTVTNNLAGTLSVVREGWTGALATGNPPWALILLDLCFYTGRVTEESHARTAGMPAGRPGDDDPRSYFGLTLLDAIHREFPELPVFMLSSKPRDDVSLEFTRRGALGFIARNAPNARELFGQALWQHGLVSDPAGEIVGHSLPVLLALREARRAARHRENVLIRGERGTGKELLAGYMHRAAGEAPGGSPGESATGPYVTVNSGAFAQNIFASELFGIEPRTATGVDGKIGLIEAADGGDLFLDEIGDLPPEVQAAMLRVLQERQVVRVGGRAAKQVDVRFISATNVNLEAAERGFRSDLLDRLRAGGTIWLPPLRERAGDIPLLAEKFVRQAEAQHRGARKRELTPEALEVLSRHDWPGNVRELKTVIFDAVGRHADVEYLVPAHIRLQPAPTGNGLSAGVAGRSVTANEPAAREPLDGGAPRPEDPSAVAGRPGEAGSDLDKLLAAIRQLRFTPDEARRRSGALAECQEAATWLLAHCLEAYLEAFRNLSSGDIQYQLAVRKGMEDEGISGAKAADLIKRLLKPIENQLSGTLQEAHNRAIALRSGKSKGTSDGPAQLE